MQCVGVRGGLMRRDLDGPGHSRCGLLGGSLWVVAYLLCAWLLSLEGRPPAATGLGWLQLSLVRLCVCVRSGSAGVWVGPAGPSWPGGHGRAALRLPDPRRSPPLYKPAACGLREGGVGRRSPGKVTRVAPASPSQLPAASRCAGGGSQGYVSVSEDARPLDCTHERARVRTQVQRVVLLRSSTPDGRPPH